MYQSAEVYVTLDTIFMKNAFVGLCVMGVRKFTLHGLSKVQIRKYHWYLWYRPYMSLWLSLSSTLTAGLMSFRGFEFKIQ